MTICKGCQGPIENSRNKYYCSHECFRKRRDKNRKCPICSKTISTRNKKYCSYECSGKSKVKDFPNDERECQRCGKKFRCKKSESIRFCSSTCKAKKFTIDESFFETLTPDVIRMIGRLSVIGFIKDYRTIYLLSDLKTLRDILDRLKSDHRIERSERGLWKVIIFSEKLVSDLFPWIGGDLRLSDFPDLDFGLILDGIKQTHCFDGLEYRLQSSKIGLELGYRLGMGMEEVLYKDWVRGRIGREFRVY